MSDRQTVGPWIGRFLLEHVVTERNLSRNTQKSYRDTFKLLMPFVGQKARKAVDRLAFGDLTAKRVRQFLGHIEDERRCSVQTRNQRLAAIRAFAAYVASREPAHIGWCGQIRAIQSKKASPASISWLTTQEMTALLDVPDRKTARGRNEYALLLFLYRTGARVSEAVQVRVGDLQINGVAGDHALVTLHGKGGKVRQCPLRPRTEGVLANLVAGRAATDAVFLSRLRKPFTRHGVYRMVERCAAGVPALSDRRITPHVLRHTTACHLVDAGVDLNTVRAWLGHVSLNTTNIYAEISLERKAQAIAMCDMAEEGPARPWRENKGLMAALRDL